MTSGQDTWSARCVETRTAGAAGGPGKPTGSNPGRAPRSDPTGAFYRSALYPLLRRINYYLVRWLRKKYKRLRLFKKAQEAWKRGTSQYPSCFAHWRWVTAFR
jgi:hypothetical protein